MERKFLAIGASFAFLAVVTGAFGAHILKNHLNAALQATFETAVKYQMYHSLALILVSLLTGSKKSKWLLRSGWFFVAGTIIFSGSLYALCFTGVKWMGAITPLGGLAFLSGWLCLVVYAIRKTE